jgi:AraC family transcriptional regulator, transcriptional activator of pobA
MKKYQPLLLQKLDIHLPGLQIRRLAVHRHLSETTDIRPHAHKFSQCLIYMSGQGQQRIGEADYATRSGTAVFFPPQVEHAFHRLAYRHPICLIIDFDWRGAPKRAPKVVPLSLSVLHEIRQLLAGISHLQRQPSAKPPLLMSASIIKLLDAILGGMGLIQQHSPEPMSPIARKVEALLASPEAAGIPLGKLSGLAGYQHDYLNRLLKNHAGLTLGQFRSRKLVPKAQQLLRLKDSIAAVASEMGFTEPNYFARWFRKQTGLTPTAWRRQNQAAGGRV